MQTTINLLPNTTVKIIAGAHKGKKGVIGDAKGAGRNNGKVLVTQLGRKNESYWISPNYLEAEEVEEQKSDLDTLVQERSPQTEPEYSATDEPLAVEEKKSDDSSTNTQIEADAAPAPPPQETRLVWGKTWIDLHSVALDAGTQSRHETDWETVQTYKEQMAEGLWDWEREPLVAIFQTSDGRMFHGDGRHRLEAAIAAEVSQIYVDLRPGTLTDAIMNSCTANTMHGLPLRPKDHRKRIELFLNTREQLPEGDERKTYSTREIARYLRLTDSGYRTVVNIINEREMAGKISQFKEGDRVELVSIGACAAEVYWPKGTLGMVRQLDKKKGIFFAPDAGARDSDGRSLPSGWIDPDYLAHSDAPPTPEIAPSTPPNVKISQQENDLNAIKPTIESAESHSSVEEEMRSLGKELGLKPKKNQVLPDIESNDAPVTVDDRPFACSTSAIPVNTAEICTSFIANIEYLDHDHLVAAVKAIAQRTNSRILALMSDAELKDLINQSNVLLKRAKNSLNKRNHPEYSNE